LFADCALNIDPDPSQLADIAIASAETWQALQERPARVAFLSFSTHGSGKHPAVDRVVEALAIARIRRPDLLFEGELQADAALSERVAGKKLGEVGAVAGRANVLVFPGLEAANIAYKLVQHLAGARATGPLLQGFARPVSDLSRGATADDIVDTAILTLARAAHGQLRSAIG
jgi:phosphate acetyltransferase